MNRVVEAALRIARTEGLDALTMRRLAEDLGVTHMAAYYYVRDKSQLVSLVADAALESVVLPGPEAGTWEQRWLVQIQSALDVLAEFPGLGQAMVNVRLTPEATRLTQGVLDMLTENGFTSAEARQAYSAVHTYVIGRMMIKQRLATRPASGAGSARARDSHFPRTRPISSSEFESYALMAILSGIRSVHSPATTAKPARSRPSAS